MKNADISVYRIAFHFAGVASLTTVAIGTVLYPNISNWSTRNKNHTIAPALAKSFTYSLLLAIPVFIGGLLLGDRLLYFFYGAGYAQGAPVLYLILAAQVVNVLVVRIGVYKVRIIRMKIPT